MITRPRPKLAVVLLSQLIALFVCYSAQGQTQAPAFIRNDTVWSGVVEVAHDVSIIAAEVRVQAGTTIRFTGGRGGRGAVIRLSSPLFGDKMRPARLILNGTADRPIVIETTEQASPGAIESVTAGTCALDARHVVFRGLGAPADEDSYSPAILLRLTAPEDDIWLTDCRFEDCGPVRAEFMGPDASGQITGCTFVKTRGPLAVRLKGTGTGVKIIRDNVVDAGVEIDCSQTRVSDNVLVGEHASVVIRRSAAQGVAVVGNYVHCTTRKDVGRYAVKSEAASTRLVGNVLVGGSYVVETPPRVLQGNVVIGVGDLEGNVVVTGAAKDLPGIRTMTHALVTNIPPGGRLTENLFLGPAYAAVSVSTAVPFGIANCVFDGWGVARQAVLFDVAATGDARVGFIGNLVGGYTQTPVEAESKPSRIDLQASKNVFVGVDGAAYQGFAGINGLAGDDLRVESLTNAPAVPGGQKKLQMMKGSPATQAATDVDEALINRRKTVDEVRKQWFEIYGRRGASTPE